MKKIFYFFIFILLFSCQQENKGKLEKKISDYIEKNCFADTCYIDLNDIISFEWVELYVFNENSSLETIESVIGRDYPYYLDIGEHMIFVNENNEIVYHEYKFPRTDFINKEIFFDLPDNNYYRIFKNKEFKVIKQKTEKGVFYILDQN